METIQKSDGVVDSLPVSHIFLFTYENKLFKNRPKKFFGRQPLKNSTWFIFEYVVPYNEQQQ